MRRGLLLVLLCAGVASAGQTESPARTLETTIARASQYVATFVASFSHVVSEERYSQEWRPSFLSSTRREWVADFLLVRTDGAAGWLSFRDVFQVNGAAVRDRSERLEALFVASSGTAGTAAAQADAISKESARYNIGPKRTVNNPLLALAFLQDLYRARFQFSLEGRDRVKGRAATVIGYLETARPTIIRGAADLPAHGRFWVDEQDGSILKTELITEDATQHAQILVEFQFDDRFHLWTPLEMKETYDIRRTGVASATAKYGRFRGFEVTTSEQRR